MHGLLLLSARAVHEARAMKQEFGAVRDQLQRRDEALADARRGQSDARLERVTAVRRRADQLSSRLATLHSLADALAPHASAIDGNLGHDPVMRPTTHDDAAWVAYVEALEAAVKDMQAIVAQVGGELGARVRASVVAAVEVPGIDEVLASHVMQRQLKPGLDANQTERFRATAARILTRLDLSDGDAVPGDLQALARAVVLAPSLDRAEALASELRRAVQIEREARSRRDADAAQARLVLEQLPQDAPLPLMQALERVVAGIDQLDAALRAAVDDCIRVDAATQDQRAQEAAALVLEESLRDLGYDVEGIEATLFAQGGATHFRRPGWEHYCVRMRVDAGEQTVNFNVVRARGDQETSERRRLDALAEDRWCAEFPKLLQTLAARGLQLKVTRRLAAGELPVQVVDGATLPGMHEDDDEDARGPRSAPRFRQRP
jgi:hypothetical protein